jgi:hypothetical protein
MTSKHLLSFTVELPDNDDVDACDLLSSLELMLGDFDRCFESASLDSESPCVESANRATVEREILSAAASLLERYQDTEWGGFGCERAARKIAAELRLAVRS